MYTCWVSILQKKIRPVITYYGTLSASRVRTPTPPPPRPPQGKIPSLAPSGRCNIQTNYGWNWKVTSLFRLDQTTAERTSAESGGRGGGLPPSPTSPHPTPTSQNVVYWIITIDSGGTLRLAALRVDLNAFQAETLRKADHRWQQREDDLWLVRCFSMEMTFWNYVNCFKQLEKCWIVAFGALMARKVSRSKCDEIVLFCFFFLILDFSRQAAHQFKKTKN